MPLNTLALSMLCGTVPKLQLEAVFQEPVPVQVLIRGCDSQVKPARLAVPPGVTTFTRPLAPPPTTAVIIVSLKMVKLVAARLPKLSAEASVKWIPLMVTVSPGAAEVGEKEVITGAGIKVKPDRLSAPPGVLTLTLPEAPDANTAVMVVALMTVKEDAAVLPKLTSVAPLKLLPVMVTVAPPAAEVGVKEVITGAGTKVKPARVSLPPNVWMMMLPLEPVPTMADTVVSLSTVKPFAAVAPN